MNLKEAFRYQTFLSDLMDAAACSIRNSSNGFKVVKNHLLSAVDQTMTDRTEEVEDTRTYKNDDVIALMDKLINERLLLSTAIFEAKQSARFSIGIDIDSAVETNKFRQRAANAIKGMLSMKSSKHTERGQGWKFDVSGVQSPYYYEIEVVTTEDFDRDKSKGFAHDLRVKADEYSSAIDKALINTIVDYEPPFDVNESFEDVMAEFLSR